MTNLLTPEEKVPVTIEDEVRRSYLDYAMSVIIGRALPDVRDGLKPVHRRCLYGMWEQGNLHNKPYSKSARIVGDVIGKYHPHGESAIYDSVVRMAQDFSLRYPLVDGQGNFGSIDGDNAAAMRYTEVRLTRLAEEMLGDDIDKETVDWTPNYDGSLVEPMVLPAKFPNLLVNGSSGIAVGMATNIPPHNLAEVIDATIELIKHPDATLATADEAAAGPGLPDRAASSTAPRASGTPTRPAAASSRCRARAVIEKTARGDKEVDRRHRDPLPGQQGEADRAHRRARQRQEDRGDLRPARRVRPRRHPDRRRAEARRERAGHPQQAVRADADADRPSASSSWRSSTTSRGSCLSTTCCATSSTTARSSSSGARSSTCGRPRSAPTSLRGLALALANLDLVIKIIRASKDPAEAKKRLTAEISMTRAALEKFIGVSLGDEGGKGTRCCGSTRRRRRRSSTCACSG